MIGNKIKEIREKRNISQRGLAIKTGITNATISRIENGLVTPDVSSLQKISNALNTYSHLLPKAENEIITKLNNQTHGLGTV